MLEKVVGPGNVAVRVNAVFNFDQEQSHSEILEPVIDGAGAVISEQTYAEETRGPSVWAEGVPAQQPTSMEMCRSTKQSQTTNTALRLEVRKYAIMNTLGRLPAWREGPDVLRDYQSQP